MRLFEGEPRGIPPFQPTEGATGDEYQRPSQSRDRDEPAQLNGDGLDRTERRCIVWPQYSLSSLNEVTHYGTILMSCYPDLFPLGNELNFANRETSEEGETSGDEEDECKSKKPRRMNREVIRKLLLYYDGRFQKCSQFLFHLANTIQRKTVNIACAKIRSSKLEEFKELCGRQGFTENLRHAAAHPESALAKQLARELLPLLSVPGAAVPFSALEKGHVRAHARAMQGLRGAPAMFNTFTYRPEESKPLLRMIACSVANPRAVNVVLPEGREATDTTNEHPAFAARVYEKYRRLVRDVLYKCGSNVKTTAPLPSAFGYVYADIDATEMQGKGTLHNHANTWTTLSPSLIFEASMYRELHGLIAKALDSIVTARVSNEVRELFGNDWRSAKCSDVCREAPGETYEEIVRYAEKIAYGQRAHRSIFCALPYSALLQRKQPTTPQKPTHRKRFLVRTPLTLQRSAAQY